MFAHLVVAAAQSLPAAPTAAEELQAQAERALKTGDYPQTIRLALEAARLFHAAGAKQRVGVAFNTAGAAGIHLGDYPAALGHLEKALALARETGDRDNEILRLNNIGALHVFLGNYADAFARFQAALDRLAGAESQPWYLKGRQLTLGNLAILWHRLGQDQRALETYQQLRALPIEVAPNIQAQLLTGLAVVYRRLGDPQKALDTYRTARGLLAKDPNAAASLYTLHNIGVVQARDFEDYPAAVRTFEEGLAIAKRTGNRQLETVEQLYLGETWLLMKKPAAARAALEAALAEAEALKLVDEKWTALYGLGRAEAALHDQASAMRHFEQAISVIESARSRLGVASLKAEFLAGKRDVYDAAIAQLLDQPHPDAARIFRHIEEGRARNLKETLPREGRALTLESVQRLLDGQTMLLEYWAAGGRLAVVWITRAAAGVAQRPIGEAETKAVESLARALSDPSSTAWAGLVQPSSQALLLAGVPFERPGIGHLVIVPDGGLPSLPFEVLNPPGASGGGRRLIDAFDVSYLPSAQFLGRHGVGSPARRWPWQVTLTAFADPITPPARTGLFDTNWARLTHSAAEARAVARALPGAERLHIGADNLRGYVVGGEASLSPVLHFATHAAMDVSDTRRSRILFTPSPGNPASQYLFWGDIAKLKLDGVELVTLAACETAQGRYVRGEGVENFSRAFLGAGSAATVSSLWRVSDEATGILMRRFYEQLAAGATKASALRQAKLALASSSGGAAAHPFFWAPFLLTGDGGSPLTPTVSWTWFAIATLIALAAIAGLARALLFKS